MAYTDVHAHFKKNDPAIYQLLEKIELSESTPSKEYFTDLCDSIISQQLSVKAAAAIFDRFKKLFPHGYISPEHTLRIDDALLRQAGLSYAKIKYVKDLAQKVMNKEIHLELLQGMTDEEVINELVKVKGIGVWTAEMFLLFTLCRTDIFSCGDLGLQNAIKKLYNLQDKPTKQELLEISAKWTPYRSIATRLLWKSLNLPK